MPEVAFQLFISFLLFDATVVLWNDRTELTTKITQVLEALRPLFSLMHRKARYAQG